MSVTTCKLTASSSARYTRSEAWWLVCCCGVKCLVPRANFLQESPKVRFSAYIILHSALPLRTPPRRLPSAAVPPPLRIQQWRCSPAQPGRLSLNRGQIFHRLSFCRFEHESQPYPIIFPPAKSQNRFCSQASAFRMKPSSVHKHHNRFLKMQPNR